MGLFDSAKDKVTQLAGDNKDKVDQGIDQAGDMVDEKTGGKFSGQVDQAQEMAKNQVDNQG